MSVVPPIVAGLVSGGQQNGRTPGIESVQDPKRIAPGLGPQFTHFGEAGRLHLRTEGKSEIGAMFHQEPDPRIHFSLIGFRQGVPPSFELIGELDIPGHSINIALKPYRPYAIYDSLIHLYASMHLGAAVPNFFKVENALGPFRGSKEKMAQGPEPAVRKSVFPVPEGPGLGLDLNEDWLRAHVAKDDQWWG